MHAPSPLFGIRPVLTFFGEAYGTLPERSGDLSRDQHVFLDRAISGLSQDGKIVPVRLALFAEMIKERSWTTQTLREIGGTEGVGVTFLEETFVSPQANPKHRLHQKASQAVLKALLPETSTEIKRQMRSRQELLEVSGYTNRPKKFDDLLGILDHELRLITPTDPEGSLTDGQSSTRDSEYYQLAHDYIVHPLREWLTRKQKGTRSGRAELILEDCYALWKHKKEYRYLPGLTETLSILLHVKLSTMHRGKKMMLMSAVVETVFYSVYYMMISALFITIGWTSTGYRIVLRNDNSTIEPESVTHVLRLMSDWLLNLGIPLILFAMLMWAVMRLRIQLFRMYT
jgi:hypothetical protein